MKPLSTYFYVTAFLILSLSFLNETGAQQQQYKLRQSTGMMGMQSESTIYVKGMRKRTEGGSYTGQPNNIVTIEQCDLQRTIKLNDKKKLYYILPFSKNKEEVIDEDAKPVAAKTKPAAVTQPPEKGGTIHMWYNITDTGERKKMYGFTARHIWTSQKMKPTTDACMMKDSMIIKTDGWYIDFPSFNCPETYSRAAPQGPQPKLDCQDRFVTHRSGKGKLGFPLTETRTMIMGNGQAKTSEFKTELETVELSTLKLDSMLFEIPPGYKEATNESELKDKFDVNEYIKQNSNKGNPGIDKVNAAVSSEKKQGAIRIGVLVPTGEAQLPGSSLQQQLAGTLSGGNIEAVAVGSADEAKQLHCDYTLNSDIVKMKQASKMGGLIKAIKNTDPNAASSYNIEANLVLITLSDGSTRSQQTVSGKYEGKPEEAARKALEEGGRQVIKGIK